MINSIAEELSDPILSVSIVLYKTTQKDLRACLSSLRLFGGRIYLYIVDNSPTDALKCECPSDLPCEYIHLPGNPGFGAGHNVAIHKGQVRGSKYHLVLNADVKFDSDVISPMLAYMECHKNVGHMMPKILNFDGSVQRLCKLVPSPIDLLFRRFARRKVKEKSNFRFELHFSGYDKVVFVPYLSGCFMLLRQDALKEVGVFDERFFMYPEDIDLTRRIAVRYETLFFPHVAVFHAHGAASRKSLRMFSIHFFNIIKYFNKWGWFYDPVRRRLNEKTLVQFDDLDFEKGKSF